MIRLLAVAACALVLLAAASARAQIVNVQPLLAQGDRPGLSGAVEGSMDWRTGNNPLTQLAGSGLGRYQAPSYLVFLLGRAELGTGAKGRFQNRSLVHLRYRLELLERFQPEVFLQHDRDEFRRLALRALAGCGPRLPIVRGDPLELAAGVAYMLELEHVEEDAAPGGIERTVDGRMSTYLALRAKVSSVLRIGHTVYLQPRVDRPSDFRLLTEAELVVKLNEHFGLKLAPALTYDSEPPSGLVSLDTTFKTSLQVSW